MKKIRKSWKGRHVALFIFLVCFSFFNWPLLSIPIEKGGIQAVISLFSLWLLAIFCLWFYSHNESEASSEHQRDEEQS